jgi:hypothetical protein
VLAYPRRSDETVWKEDCIAWVDSHCPEEELELVVHVVGRGGGGPRGDILGGTLVLMCAWCFGRSQIRTVEL